MAGLCSARIQTGTFGALTRAHLKAGATAYESRALANTDQDSLNDEIGAVDVRARLAYCAGMAKNKKTKKNEKTAFLGNLDRLGGKKLMQHGAEESSRAKESRKHSVGGGRKSG